MRHSFAAYCLFLIFQCAFLHTTLAVPTARHFSTENVFNSVNETFYDDDVNTRIDLKARQDLPLLRIMPLGASITQGLNVEVVESQQNGYRRLLREQLRYWGYPVNMIGSRSNGDFIDKQHEGHPGFQITAIASAMKSTLSRQKPNLVLINAGTNDCVQADDRNYTPLPGGLEFVEGTYDRMKAMIETIYSESEGATVILSTLINNQGAVTDNYVNIANAGFRQLVLDLQAEGKKIQLADMNTGFITLDDHSDGTHPNAAGYEKMAAIWAAAFKQVEAKNWITTPIDTGTSDGGDCYPTPDGFRGPVKTQVGSGFDDGLYLHSSVLDGKFSYYGAAPKSLVGEWNHFHFAQLVSNGGNEDNGYPLDEFIRVLDPDDRSLNNLPYLSYMVNNGDGTFGPGYTTIQIVSQGTPECLSRGVRWGDVNGDSLDDFICVNTAGSIFVSLNRGGNPPKFEYIGDIRDDRFPQKDVRLADIDGDGRLDFCGLDTDGTMSCHRNGGTGDAPLAKYGGYWQGMLLDGGGATFDRNFINTNNEGLRLVDLNGDGRADWVYFYEDTSTEIFINQRGGVDDGKGLKPHWVAAQSTIVGWPDDKSVNRTNIMFGRVFGSGRSDLVRVAQVGEHFDYTFELHRNTGSGGAKVKGDGARYCDMFGRGYDDYLWVWGGGMIDLFENINPGSSPMWLDHGRIFETAKDRKFLHFGDWDGDGLCDILYVDRTTGNVDMWRNTYTSGQTSPTFASAVRVASGSLCPQEFSPALTDLAVRFGDLDGDGRIDYLCMDPDGRTRGWLNTAGGLEAMSPNQIKVSVGYDRANHRWADVNGDGKVDFLWVDKHAGNVKTWINGGITPALDSSMYWDQQTDIWMAGVERGQNIHFPQLSTSGRADYHWVHPQTSVAYTYFNECSGGDGGQGAADDGAITDPGLPAVPGVICSRSDAGCDLTTPEDVAAARTKWPKVDWAKTATTCTLYDDFIAVVNAHAKAVEVMQFTPSLQDAYETTGFNRYFVSSTLWFDNIYFSQQNDKHVATLEWAAGANPTPDTATSMTTYHCKDPDWVVKDADRCDKNPGVGAKTHTVPTADTSCPYCNVIVLCNLWWESPTIDSITATKRYLEDLPYAQEQGLKWAPREHTLVHEWFHNYQTDSFPKTVYHIIDVTDTVLGVERVIYGAGVASAYAWAGFGTGSVLDGQIQQKTMDNADSFAWMVSYNWYEKAFGWVDDGRWKSGWAVTKRSENGTVASRTDGGVAEKKSVWKRLAGWFSMSR